MANIKSFPNNQDVYVGAQEAMKWLHGRTSGVFAVGNNASVTTATKKMAINISDGYGWISNENKDGVAWWIDSEKETGQKLELELGMADSALDIIGRVVITWATTNYVDLPTIEFVRGKAASNPVPPALVNNGSQRQISLAQIKIPAGATSINNGLITDERMNSEVCGIVTDNIEIPTDMVQNQFSELLKSLENEISKISGGTGFDLAPVRKENVVIKPSMFHEFASGSAEENKLRDLGFNFIGTIPISGVLSNMTPYITLSLGDLGNSGVSIANQFQCYTGGIQMYADGIPSGNITALTVECRKAVT